MYRSMFNDIKHQPGPGATTPAAPWASGAATLRSAPKAPTKRKAVFGADAYADVVIGGSLERARSECRDSGCLPEQLREHSPPQSVDSFHGRCCFSSLLRRRVRRMPCRSDSLRLPLLQFLRQLTSGGRQVELLSIPANFHRHLSFRICVALIERICLDLVDLRIYIVHELLGLHC